MTKPADDFLDLMRREATAPDPRPLYYLWVYDPDKDELHIDHNEDKHPAWKHTFQSIAPHVHHPERVRGRAFAIKGGWRIMDEDNHDADPYIARKVHEKLRQEHPPPKLPTFGSGTIAKMATSVSFRPISPPGDGEQAIGAFQGGRQVGHVSYTPSDARTYIDVLEAYPQGQGTGTALMNHLLAERGHGVEALDGDFTSWSPEAAAFWRKYLGRPDLVYDGPEAEW